MGALIMWQGGAWWFVANGEQVPGVVTPPPAPTVKYLDLPGSVGAVARVTEADASLDLTGSHTMYALLRVTDWAKPSPGGTQIIASKWADPTNRSYVWALADFAPYVGGPFMQYSTTGSAIVERYMPVPSPVMTTLNNTWVWARWRFDAPTGNIDFATSPVTGTPDPSANPAGLTWTIRSSLAGAGAVAALFSGSARFTIGSIDSGDYGVLTGSVAQLVMATGTGTIVFKLDPSNWTTGTTWTTSTGHTVTLGGAATVAVL